jgi:3-oxoacyl-[acyl-carrier protein] reductase
MTACLEGRVAIVTGAGRGIGRAEALLLATEGAAVVVNDVGASPEGDGRDPSAADAVVEEIHSLGGRAIADYSDVSLYASGATLVRLALSAFGRLDIVINNAGNVRTGMVFNLEEEDFDSVVGVHLKGTFNLCRHACGLFREQRRGVIVNTSSESGLGIAGQSVYSAAKEGIVGLTRTLAREMGGYGVRCNAIRPRAATRLTVNESTRAAAARGARAFRSPEYLEAFAAENPPEAAAALAVWLCTDEAANVNGRTFVIGGGYVGLYDEPKVPVSASLADGTWTLDELRRRLPEEVTGGLVNRWWPGRAQERRP